MSCPAGIFIWPAKYVAHSSIWTKVSVSRFFKHPTSCFVELSLCQMSLVSPHTSIFLQADTQLNCSVVLLHIFCIAPKTQWKIRIPLLNEEKKKRVQTKKLSSNDYDNKRSLPYALLWAIHQLAIKKGHLTVLLLFSILVKTIIPCSPFKKYRDNAVCHAVSSWTRRCLYRNRPNCTRLCFRKLCIDKMVFILSFLLC